MDKSLLLDTDNIWYYFWELFMTEFNYLCSYDLKSRVMIARKRVLDFMFIKHAKHKNNIIYALDNKIIPNEFKLREFVETNNKLLETYYTSSV